LVRETVEINEDKVNELIAEASELSKIIASIILNTKNNKF